MPVPAECISVENGENTRLLAKILKFHTRFAHKHSPSMYGTLITDNSRLEHSIRYSLSSRCFFVNMNASFEKKVSKEPVIESIVHL